jgi:hypothetical protein
MSLFNNILQKIQKNIDSQNNYKQEIIDCLQQDLNITITPDAIVSLKDGVLVLRTHPTIKMALLLKKDVIIKNLQKRSVAVSVIK